MLRCIRRLKYLDQKEYLFPYPIITIIPDANSRYMKYDYRNNSFSAVDYENWMCARAPASSYVGSYQLDEWSTLNAVGKRLPQTAAWVYLKYTVNTCVRITL